MTKTRGVLCLDEDPAAFIFIASSVCCACLSIPVLLLASMLLLKCFIVFLCLILYSYSQRNDVGCFLFRCNDVDILSFMSITIN